MISILNILNYIIVLLISYYLFLFVISVFIYFPYIKYSYKMTKWKLINKDVVIIRTDEKNVLIKDVNKNIFYLYTKNKLTMLVKNPNYLGILQYILYTYCEKITKK